MEERERQELVDELLEALDRRGAPDGAWLISIAEARRALADVDALLRRLEDTIIRRGPDRPG